MHTVELAALQIIKEQHVALFVTYSVDHNHL